MRKGGEGGLVQLGKLRFDFGLLFEKGLWDRALGALLALVVGGQSTSQTLTQNGRSVITTLTETGPLREKEATSLDRQS